MAKPLFLVHHLQSMSSSDHTVLFTLNLDSFFCYSTSSLASLAEKNKTSMMLWWYAVKRNCHRKPVQYFLCSVTWAGICLTNGPRNCIVNAGLRPSCQGFTSFTTAEAIRVFLCLEISLYYLTLQLGSARVMQVSHLGPNQIVNLHLLWVKCFWMQ